MIHKEGENMAEFEELAYQDIRNSIVQNWNRFHLLNENGEVVYSGKVNNSKGIWIHNTSRAQVLIGTDVSGNPIYAFETVQSNPDMVLQISITGNDVTLPCNIASFELVNINSYNTNARLKETLDSIVPLKISSDTFVYKINLKVGA